MKQTIVFTANKTIVTANKYVPYALYKQNTEIVEQLGGEVCKGNEGFVAKFKTVAKAKEFVEKAICHMPKSEYNASRKTAPKKTANTTVTKGKGKTKEPTETETVTIAGKTYTLEATDDGFMLVPVAPKSAKGKGKASPTKKTTVAKGKGKGKTKTLTDREKQRMAYEQTNASFKRKVAYKTWRAKYEEILASL